MDLEELMELNTTRLMALGLALGLAACEGGDTDTTDDTFSSRS